MNRPGNPQAIVIRSPGRRGFTVIEMAITIAVAFIVLAILLPSLGRMRRSGYLAVCASNQHQIHLAFNARKIDEAHQRIAAFSAPSWMNTLHPYVDSTSRVYVCPEDDELNSGVSELQAAVDMQSKQQLSGADYFLNLLDGPFVRKLSDAQYQYVVATRGDTDGANGSWGQYFRNEYKGYDPGNDSTRYWLMLEDISRENAPAGDKDFDDVRVFVQHLSNGKIRLQARKGHAGYTHWLIDADGKEILNPKGVLAKNDTRSVDLDNLFGSYGMNSNVRERMAGQKVLMLDYEKNVANPIIDRWDYLSDASGNAKFARHVNRSINSLRFDGSLLTVQAGSIDPSFASNRAGLWTP